MLNVSKQIKLYSLQLKACFNNNNKLPISIVIFIVTGLVVLWLYIAQAIMLYYVRMLQIPSAGLTSFIKDEHTDGRVRATMMLIAYPVAIIGYVICPLMYLLVWSIQFCFNCFAFITSLGKSKWVSLQFD